VTRFVTRFVACSLLAYLQFFHVIITLQAKYPFTIAGTGQNTGQNPRRASGLLA
jgi:hypothetical protein